MRYEVFTFGIVRQFETLEDAEKAYYEMIRDGFRYVELKEIVQETPYYYAFSLKIHH